MIAKHCPHSITFNCLNSLTRLLASFGRDEKLGDWPCVPARKSWARIWTSVFYLLGYALSLKPSPLVKLASNCIQTYLLHSTFSFSFLSQHRRGSFPCPVLIFPCVFAHPPPQVHRDLASPVAPFPLRLVSLLTSSDPFSSESNHAHMSPLLPFTDKL